MSTALKTSIVARMRGDDALDALLARHPSDVALPAVFEGNARQRKAMVYPSITYRIAESRPDDVFKPSQAAGGGASSVENAYLEMEAWSNTPDSATIEEIVKRLNGLFEGVTFTLEGGRVFDTERIVSQCAFYDPDLECWFGLLRYRLRIQF